MNLTESSFHSKTREDLRQYNLARSAKRRAEELALFAVAQSATTCVDWPWGVNTSGYGQLGKRTDIRLAHRASYEYSFGLIPDSQQVLHHCDRPICIAACHLYLGGVRENIDDRILRNRCALGFRNGNAKLTADLVLAIRADPLNDRQCGFKYGVGNTCVSNIRKRKSWKHVP